MGNRELEPRLSGTAFPRVVLFDLDGTLLDSAPDMLAAINVLRGERGHAPATLEQLRPHVSKGARAMILSAFPQLDEAAREALEIGRAHVCTPVTNAHLVCRHLLEKKTRKT